MARIGCTCSVESRSWLALLACMSEPATCNAWAFRLAGAVEPNAKSRTHFVYRTATTHPDLLFFLLLASDEQSCNIEHNLGIDHFLVIPILEAKSFELSAVFVFCMLAWDSLLAGPGG